MLSETHEATLKKQDFSRWSVVSVEGVTVLPDRFIFFADYDKGLANYAQNTPKIQAGELFHPGQAFFQPLVSTISRYRPKFKHFVTISLS